ncbi:MAG: FkbM family methyltransferase [Flavobacterium sp.]|nr:FkbM family methyltransferase [Flavobacterium sp.]
MSLKSAANLFINLIPTQLKSRIIVQIDQRRQQKFLNQLRSKIIDFYQTKSIRTEEEEIVVRYLASNPVTVFPYDFQKKYDKSAINVMQDVSNGLRYVMHDHKKLYFKRSYSEAKIKSLYHGLQLDQDPDSPHLYLTDDFNLNSNDVIADIGAAEGNFSLSNIETVKKIYLFECDAEWIEALEATFEPWKEKVVICNQFVSNSDQNDSVALDTFVNEHDDITFLKVDIEGEEANFLAGAKKFLQAEKQFKMAICTYHKQDDEVEFTTILERYNLEVRPTNGFMIFYHDQNIKDPYLRRGLLRVQKKLVKDA